MKRLMVPAMLAVCSCALLEPAVLPGTAEGEFRLWMPDACGVQLLGDWNEWGGMAGPSGLPDPEAGRMERAADGWWTITVDLPRGRHRYVFLVDGVRFVTDPLNPLTSTFMGLETSLAVTGR
ncbi:hypothetical protein GX411_10735 [Candidatus Fermentibacteria bacterium]|nr:hypothetical protein [Candidatus Fermentibacteria bacterium]